MIEKQYLKWSLLVPTAFFALAALGVFLYLIIPFIISLVTGVPDACSSSSYAVSDNTTSINNSISSLCTTSQSFLGVATITLIFLVGVLGYISIILTTVDIIQSKTMDTLRKVVWLFVMWFILGFIAAAAYYFIERKD